MDRFKRLTADEINALLGLQPGWQLSADKLSITTAITFTSFQEAWKFMTTVAEAAEQLNHHPNWSNAYNNVSIRLTTHDANSLTERDLRLAKCIADALQEFDYSRASSHE